jgi:hypothetical protein
MKKNIIKLSFAFLLLAGCTSKLDFTTPSAPVTPSGSNSDLIISELSTAINTFTGPTGAKDRNHYVELYNGTNGSIDLSKYAIGYQAVTDTNTLSPWSFTDSSYLVLGGSLASKKCYVIASPIADTSVVKSDITWGTSLASGTGVGNLPLQLSGNSAIALLKKDAAGTYILAGNNYKIIDVFGSPLVARLTTTGKTSTRNNIIWAFGDTTNDTRNRTFWRKASVTGPQSDWNISNAAGSSQWKVSGDKLWDYKNIGLPTAP